MSLARRLWQIVALSIRHVVRMIVTNVRNERVKVRSKYVCVGVKRERYRKRLSVTSVTCVCVCEFVAGKGVSKCVYIICACVYIMCVCV